MYTAEQIKPKKYSDEKPSENRAYVNYRVLLDNGTQSLFNWNPVTPSETMMTWDKYVTWFIDIPNPPEELRFLAYPQNKPSEDGEYWVHDCYLDIWCRAIWDGDISSVWTANVDYFINMRLDKENEMDVNKRLDKLEDVLTELQVFLNGEGILPSVRYFNDDVVKREPELLPCPNPECEGNISDIYTEQKENDYWVTYCDYCGLKAPMEYTREQSIKIWNALPRKEK